MCTPEITKALELPNFTQAEKERIVSWFCVTNFQHVGEIIPINTDWNLEIKRDADHSFKTNYKDSTGQAFNFLIKTGSVGLYSGSGEDMWHVGFKLISQNDTGENPYDSVQLPLKEAEREKKEEISKRRTNIKALVDSLLREDKILKNREDALRELHFDIGNQVINGIKTEEIIQSIRKI